VRRSVDESRGSAAARASASAALCVSIALSTSSTKGRSGSGGGVPIAVTVIFLIRFPVMAPSFGVVPWHERSDRPDAGRRVALRGRGKMAWRT
jgi:hypothetical protein